MLKQWKAQHQGETATAGACLPADLLEAVKGVYQRLGADAQAQVEQMRAALNAVAIAALKAENDGLTQRLADWAAEQRQSERQGFEARIGMLEHDAQQLRIHLQEHQQAVAVLRAEKQGLQHQVERANGEAKERLGAVYTLREQLTAAREMASREHMDAEMGAELLDKAEHENIRLDTRNGELLDEVAALKVQLEAAGSIRTPARGKKK